jgi:hypothetical protein
MHDRRQRQMCIRDRLCNFNWGLLQIFIQRKK